MRTFLSLAFAVLAFVCAADVVSGQEEAAGRLVMLITEGDSAPPLPSRVHLMDAAGKPVGADPWPFWRDHFVCEGRVELDLPAGQYTYQVERGPEYSQGAGRFQITTGQTTEVTVSLRRIADLAAEGWWSGESHVHRNPPEMPLHMRAEDLHIAQVITWWNERNPWSERAVLKQPLMRVEGEKRPRLYHVMAGEDERQGGALLYFGLDQPLPITGSGREYPSPVKFLRMAQERGAWIEIEKPFWWDTPVWLATGAVNSIGIANNHMHRRGMFPGEAWGRPRDMQKWPGALGNGHWTQEIYYHVLNTGLRIAPTAGSASGVLPNPVGYNRVYVHIDGDLTWEKWWDGLRAGRCFVTNGPLLRVRANGELPGHVFTAPAGGKVTIDLAAELTGREPIRTVQIIRDGQVVREITGEQWARSPSPGSLTFEESGWFLIRAFADVQHTFRFASTAPFYVEIGGRPRISRQSAQFFIDWVTDRRARVSVDQPAQLEEVMQPHDEALSFWTDRLNTANAP